MKAQLKLTLIRSKIGRKTSHLACVKALGIRKLGQSVVVAHTPENLGMIRKTGYLLKVEEV